MTLPVSLPPSISYHLLQRSSSWDTFLAKTGSYALPYLPCYPDLARLSRGALSQRPSRTPQQLNEHAAEPEWQDWHALQSPEGHHLHRFPNKPAQISFVLFPGGWFHLLPSSSLLGQTKKKHFVTLSYTAWKCHAFCHPLCCSEC